MEVPAHPTSMDSLVSVPKVNSNDFSCPLYKVVFHRVYLVWTFSYMKIHSKLGHNYKQKKIQMRYLCVINNTQSMVKSLVFQGICCTEMFSLFAFTSTIEITLWHCEKDKTIWGSSVCSDFCVVQYMCDKSCLPCIICIFLDLGQLGKN